MAKATRERDDRFDGHFTAKWVEHTKPQDKEVQYSERLKRGLSLMLYVSPNGAKTWRVVFYKKGRARTQKLGSYPKIGLSDAYKRADTFDPEKAIAADEAGTFEQVADDWIAHYVDKKRLRTKSEIERQLKRYIKPEFGKTPIFNITRKDINGFLRRVAKNHGPSQADSCLATMRSIMNWYAIQDDKYTSPIIRGMQQEQRPLSERSRKRILTDDEIRLVWKACEHENLDKVFGGIVRLLLLTGQRERKVAEMKPRHIVDGVWKVHSASREKGHIGEVKLPQIARDIIEDMPEIDGNDHVFPAMKGNGPFNSFSQRRSELDALLPKDMERWTLHDLRRTARSLLARVGVPDHIAEKVVGHQLTGVLAIYNRHPYTDGKRYSIPTAASA